jgi:hypothetical protein
MDWPARAGGGRCSRLGGAGEGERGTQVGRQRATARREVLEVGEERGVKERKSRQ